MGIMKTAKQILGNRGEELICKYFACFKCKKRNTFKRLINNFKCADLICDFCGYLAQVKTKTVKDINSFPKTILGAAWQPQKERMDAGIYFSLILVLISESNPKNYSVYYLPAELQTKEMFNERKKLSTNAKRAGWQGFNYDGSIIKDFATRLV